MVVELTRDGWYHLNEIGTQAPREQFREISDGPQGQFALSQKRYTAFCAVVHIRATITGSRNDGHLLERLLVSYLQCMIRSAEYLL